MTLHVGRASPSRLLSDGTIVLKDAGQDGTYCPLREDNSDTEQIDGPHVSDKEHAISRTGHLHYVPDK
jgi:hypothetical protein